MAGDWIKWVKGLTRRREVIQMASELGLDRRIIASCCMEIWEWLDGEVDFDPSRSCHAEGVTVEFIDGHVGIRNFAQAMINCGWLAQTVHGLDFPNSERHNGSTAKKRAQNQKRQQKRRGDGTFLSRSERDISVTREEKRREDLSSSNEEDRAASSTEAEKQFLSLWNRIEGFTKARTISGARRKAFRARMSSAEWRGQWQEALQRAAESAFCRGNNDRNWRATVDWFLRPATVTRILEGQYDSRSSTADERIRNAFSEPE